MNCKMILLATAALVIVAAGVLIANSDDSNAEVAYTFTSGNCTVDLETRADGNYDMRVYKTPGATDGNMADYAESTTSRPWQSYKNMVYSLIIEDGVTRIGNYAFAEFLYIPSLSVPDSVTSIGQIAFKNCDRLVTVDSLGTITSIPANCFYDCDRLESVKMPDTVTGITSNAFSRCYALSTVNISNSLVEINQSVFSHCPIDVIVIPASVTIIAQRAFNNNHPLTEVLNLSEVDVSGLDGFQSATIKTSIDAPALIEQSEIKSVVIGPKDDAASRMLLLIPVLAVVGIIAFLGIAIVRKYDLFD